MIQTPRLTLRPFKPEDEATAVCLLMCPEFMAYSPTGALDQEAAGRRFRDLLRGHKENGIGKMAVAITPSNTPIGYCGLELCELDGIQQIELGFRLQTSYRGRGYATEAAQALLASVDPKFSRNVIAFTEPSNQASLRVLEKLGFRKTGESSFRGMPVSLFALRRE